ncbi:alpha-glucosidase [Alicyclobacillus dauci]|uniref:Alpha-glucosidase n=1 Tax=Alicyclobacillus dauci TaxID=1475485 RepID=A0ABY6Z811_9BACL|nr:alpha-glucosidase [Alicyclobacillus dauci]WAH38165.1 alpha-glucosidase [Alicyclobacillus dauci]
MKDWWKTAVFYELYVRSFSDSNGDGVGDFPGITSKLDYLSDLGIDCIWLTPFYPSPNVDYGYDIFDYYDVDPSFGSLQDFEQFLSAAHVRGIKVIADLVLNHTSNQHPWFVESASSRSNPKRDWYIWRDEPNNWQSGFEGTSWTYDEQTGQYYYHAFSKEQVDLNWWNPDVRRELFKVVEFWLDKGIDGFRLDVINHFFVDNQFRDNPVVDGKQNHVYDKDRPETHDIVKELRQFVDRYPDKVLVGEVATEQVEIAKSYVGNAQELDLAFNFNLGSLPDFDPDRLFEELTKLEQSLEQTALPTLFFSSHDMSRQVTRFFARCDDDVKVALAKTLAAITLTAKGVPFLYYGEEIGMQDVYLPKADQIRDVGGLSAYERAVSEGKSLAEAIQIGNQKGRDKGRSPMQWSDTEYAGFSSSASWLPVNNNYKRLNVLAEEQDPTSVLSFYRNLIALRKKHSALSSGEYRVLNKSGDVIYFHKVTQDEQVVVFLNFGDSPRNVDWNKWFGYAYTSVRLLLSNHRTSYTWDGPLTLHPYEALISVVSPQEETK